MTSTRFALFLSLVLGLGGAAIACVDEGSIDNDRTAGSLGSGSKDDDDTEDDTVAEKDAGKPVVKDAGKDAGKAPVTEPSDEADPGDETDPGDQTPGEPKIDSGTPTEPKPDAGTDPETPAEPIMSVVPGSATKAMCSSYGKASGTMCAGYFCGVTQEQIAAEMPKDNICGENAVAGACDNKLPMALGKCAREVKSAIENLGATNDALRPKVRDCVFKDAEIKMKTPLPCMDCFLDAALCAGDNCLVECLAGDSKGCDTCRAKNKCDATVFTCAGLISPF